MKFWGRKRFLGLPLVVVFAFVLLLAGGGFAAARLGGVFRPQASGDIDLQRGLVGWWKLDNNGKDSTPYGASGTLTGASSAVDRKGITNKSLLLDGTTGYVDTGRVYSLDTFTASIWVYSNVSGGTRTAMSDTRDCCGTGYHGFQINTSYTGNNASIQIWGSGGTSVATAAGGTTPINSWTHYVGTYDGTTLKFYQDGALVGSTTAYSGTLGTPTANVMLGRMGAVGAGYFSGRIDDARVYSRAISAAEVAVLYKSYGAGVSAASGENGLIGWWKMDNNTKDYSPYAMAMSSSGLTLTTDRKGASNSAYTFNGTSSCVYNGSITSASPFYALGASTISAWIYPTSSGVSQVIARVGYNSDERMSLYLNGSTRALYMEIYTGTFPKYTGTSSVVNLNQWNHVAATKDASNNITFYVNGVSAGTATGAAPANNATGFAIGSAPVCSGQLFTGNIDDVRIYNRVLTTSEIASQYNSYNSQLTLSNLQKGLVGDWPLNGSARDATPYGDNGTITSATLTTDRKTRSNSAYNFNGSSWIDMGQPNNLKFTSSFSLSTWVNTSQATQGGIISKWYNTGGNRSYRFYMGAGGSIILDLSVDGTAVSSCGTTTSLNDGSWHHVVAVYDSTALTVVIYKDTSVVLSCSSRPASVFVNTQPFQLGTSDGSTAANAFNGIIDDARAWNRALTAAEVSALYKEYR